MALANGTGSDDLEPILVTGKRLGYVALNSVTATKTDTPLIDIPQTIQVVTRAQLDDQAQHSMADVLRYVPGTTVGQGEGNRDQITIRGQNTTADFFLDGVRDDVQYYRSLYNIERVEVLKGPYAAFDIRLRERSGFGAAALSGFRIHEWAMSATLARTSRSSRPKDVVDFHSSPSR